jgi:saccharopine dehydrogenase-like NADP-dependent oxidoreductase
MARDAADELDTIDYIGIKDYGVVEADEPVALWSMETFLEDCYDPAVYWEDGAYHVVPMFSGAEEYYFPPPIDRVGTVYHHCHEEPVTIPRFVGKEVGYCDFKLGDPDSETWRFIIQDLDLMNPEPIDERGVSARDVLLSRIPPTLSPAQCTQMVEEGRLRSQLMVTVDVKGTRDGVPVHYKMWSDSPDVVKACARIPGANDVSWLTSVPASILSLMLLRGQIGPVGVFPCEVLGPEEREIFFRGIREWDVKVHRQVIREL